MATVVWYIDVKDVAGLLVMVAFGAVIGGLALADWLQRRRFRRNAERAAPPIPDPECADCHVSHFTQDGKHRPVRGPS